MKKLLVSALLVAGSLSFANAQTKQKVIAKKPATSATALKTAPKTTTSAPVVKMKDKKTVAASATTTAHVKADGTADKRFKENKATAKTTPLKKDGTPDMRYKANKKK